MRVETIREQELDHYLKIISNDDSFNSLFSSWINDGITSLDYCYGIKKDDKLVGGIIYGTFDDELIIIKVNIKEFNEEILKELISESLKEVNKGIRNVNKVRCHLYSDKKNYENYIKIFLESGFDIFQRKKSFIWEKEDILKRLTKRLSYKTIKEVGKEKFIEVIENVTVGTLDQDDLSCIEKFGTKESAVKYYNQLKAIDYNEDFWKLAFTGKDELVGLIVPQMFTDKLGAINYIGVVPNQRGNGFVQELISESLQVLTDNHISKIIADIDEQNFPMEKALKENLFRLDTQMVALSYFFEKNNEDFTL